MAISLHPVRGAMFIASHGAQARTPAGCNVGDVNHTHPSLALPTTRPRLSTSASIARDLTPAEANRCLISAAICEKFSVANAIIVEPAPLTATPSKPG